MSDVARGRIAGALHRAGLTRSVKLLASDAELVRSQTSLDVG